MTRTAIFEPTAENAAKARAILEKRIESGRAAAANIFERINTETPNDAIVRGKALSFRPASTSQKFPCGCKSNEEPCGSGYHGNPAAGLTVEFGENGQLAVHRHALAQMAQRAEVPFKFLADEVEAGGWQGVEAAEILSRHYHEGLGNSRFLVRSVKGEARGFLTDKYRRLDSRPLVEAFALECQKLGAVPVDGTASDTRVTLKALLPTVYEPVPGEVMAFGVEWGNSDYGAARHTLRAFILRLWCLNGGTMEDALAQVHLGRQLSDDLDLSQRTYTLDTKTSISALRDVVQGTLAPKKVEQLCAGIRQANEKQVEWKNLSTKLARRLLKGEMETAKAAFEGEDVINLPAGKTIWRASNALSWLAGNTKDPDRKLDLQRLAGEVINGRADAEVED